MTEIKGTYRTKRKARINWVHMDRTCVVIGRENQDLKKYLVRGSKAYRHTMLVWGARLIEMLTDKEAE